MKNYSKIASESNIESFSSLASVKSVYFEEIQPSECFVVQFTTEEDNHAKHYMREFLELEQHVINPKNLYIHRMIKGITQVQKYDILEKLMSPSLALQNDSKVQ